VIDKKRKLWVRLDYKDRYRVWKTENSATPEVRSFISKEQLHNYCSAEFWTVYVESKR